YIPYYKNRSSRYPYCNSSQTSFYFGTSLAVISLKWCHSVQMNKYTYNEFLNKKLFFIFHWTHFYRRISRNFGTCSLSKIIDPGCTTRKSVPFEKVKPPPRKREKAR